MLKATLELCTEYDLEARRHAAALAKKTLEQIHREDLEELFTAARRHRLDLWGFAQKFMESPVSLRLDRPETLLTTESELLFRDFSIYCVQNHIELESAPDAQAGMSAFRTISPEAKWLAAIYSAWHAKTGEAGREIAERAPRFAAAQDTQKSDGAPDRVDNRAAARTFRTGRRDFADGLRRARKGARR